MIRIILSGFILLLTLFIFSCDRNQIFEEKVDFYDRIWPKQQQAQFDFVIPEKDVAYNIYYTLRYTNKYPYQNLYLQYYLEDSTGRVLSRELNNIQLFSAVTGIPTGDGLGDILTLQKKVIDRYSFERPGSYELSIEHFMRLDTLPEILTVGIRVEKAEQKPN